MNVILPCMIGLVIESFVEMVKQNNLEENKETVEQGFVLIIIRSKILGHYKLVDDVKICS